ncbi:MAG: HEPN domain-containing protein [Synechococcaceae bacterium WBB_10_009]|nr:HEPN domain-containing protein [Synechococcaceae bacterium WBB_10_009]
MRRVCGWMADADARALLVIAHRDLQAAQGMTDPGAFHEVVWGFQLQQAVEKALKAWLYWLGQSPAFTHDLQPPAKRRAAAALRGGHPPLSQPWTPHRLRRSVALRRAASGTTARSIRMECRCGRAGAAR